MNLSKTTTALLTIAMASPLAIHAGPGPIQSNGIFGHVKALYNGVVPSWMPYIVGLGTTGAGYVIGASLDGKIAAFNKNVQSASLIEKTPLKDYVPEVPQKATIPSTVIGTGLGGYLTYHLWKNTPEQLCNRAMQLIKELSTKTACNKLIQTDEDLKRAIGSVGEHYGSESLVTTLNRYQNEVKSLINKLNAAKKYVKGRNQELYGIIGSKKQKTDPRIRMTVIVRSGAKEMIMKTGILSCLEDCLKILETNNGKIQTSPLYIAHTNAKNNQTKANAHQIKADTAKSANRRGWLKYFTDLGFKGAKFVGKKTVTLGWNITRGVTSAIFKTLTS